MIICTPAGSVSADIERIEHFEGEVATTIEQAVEHLHQYNQRLADLMNEPITPETSHALHRLTYTLENALEYLAGELAATQAHLEKLHLASEANQGEEILSEGVVYLALSQRLFGKAPDPVNP